MDPDFAGLLNDVEHVCIDWLSLPHRAARAAIWQWHVAQVAAAREAIVQQEAIVQRERDALAAAYAAGVAFARQDVKALAALLPGPTTPTEEG